MEVCRVTDPTTSLDDVVFLRIAARRPLDDAAPDMNMDLHALDGGVEGVRATLVLLREDGLVPPREYVCDVERDRALRLLGLLLQLMHQVPHGGALERTCRSR